MSNSSSNRENDIPTEAATLSDSQRTNPTLSATLRSDYEALQNDFQQANELAADFQRQLAGKSNDFAILRQVFEKTREDMGHLQAGISELREERHRLANAAIKGEAYRLKLASVTSERDRLRIDLEIVRAALAASAEEMARCSFQRDRQIAELTVENAKLKQALLDAQRRTAESYRPMAAAAVLQELELAEEYLNEAEISFS